MYRKDSEGWLKHADFIVLDMICLQLAYVLAYAVSGYGFNPYAMIIYRNMAVFLELANLVVIFAYGTMKSIGNFVFVFIAARSRFFKINIDSYSCILCCDYIHSARIVEAVVKKEDGRWWGKKVTHYHFGGCR